MRSHHVRLALSGRLAALVFVATAVAAQQPGANNNEPDMPGTGRFPAIKEEVASQLRGDSKSAERFVGENCGLCRDSQWTLERKQFPATAGSR